MTQDTLSRIAHTVQGYTAISVNHFIPELILGAGFLLAILWDAMTRGGRAKQFSLLIAIVVLAAAGLSAANQWQLFDPGKPWRPGFFVFPYSQNLFGPVAQNGVFERGYAMAVIDNFTIFFQVLISIAGILALLMSLLSKQLQSEPKRLGQYTSLILGLSIGLYLMPASSDLLMMYLSLELSSIAGYLLAGFHRNTEHGAEGSLKYILFGALSSGMMIYGFSLFYGLTGTTNIIGIRQVLALNPLSHSGMNVGVLWAATLVVLVGIGYKISAFPFHFWTPDVYEGAPIPVTALLSVASKAAGFGMLIRFVVFVFPLGAKTGVPLIDWQTILAIGSVVTMTFGNFAALLQTNVRRMLAYSTIAHSGYMLAALAAVHSLNIRYPGIVAVAIYLATYLFMQMGAFFCVMLIANRIDSEEIGAYRGLMLRAPLVCSAFVVFLVSLTGIPLTAGFTGKFYLLTALLQPDAASHSVPWLWLAVALILNSVMSLYYYLRVVAAMFLKRPLGAAVLERIAIQLPVPNRLRYSMPAILLLFVFLIPVVLLGVYFQPLVDVASGIIRFFNFDNFRY